MPFARLIERVCISLHFWYLARYGLVHCGSNMEARGKVSRCRKQEEGAV